MNLQNDAENVSLYEAIILLKNAKEAKQFLNDLCTPQELKAMKERWNVCQFLDSTEHSYREINKITKASLTTIVRVARFLKQESYQGYRLILDRIKRGYKK